MKSSFTILLSVLILMSTTSPASVENWRSASEDPDYLHRSIKKITDVIIEDIFSPPVGSRIYAYVTIAGYEAARHGNGEYLSLSGLIPHLQPTPRPEPDKVYSFTLASVNAILIVGKSMTFSSAKIELFRKQLLGEFRAMGMPQAVFDNSIAYGQVVADHILEWSAKDNYSTTRSMEKHSFGDDPGTWQPTPPAYMKAVEPHWNKIRPFLITSAEQFKPLPATPFSSEKDSQFYKEAKQVYDVGMNLTEEQKEIANFWDCNPFKMNVRGHVMFATKKISPGGHWINIAALACKKTGADFWESINAYACLSITLADGFISCWDEKYRSNVIRPETYINQEIDMAWAPLLQTPPFPEYTSGHSVISTASARMLTTLFGDNFAFADSTEVEFGLPVRYFQSFDQAAEEAAISRLYGGIHYMPAIVNGATEGEDLGNYIIRKLQTRKAGLPSPGPSSVNTLFALLPPDQTGITFANTITESDSLNILNQANIYNGGGVGAADFNNDGLVDLYFAGNMVSNKLYLNKGNMVFADITSVAGVAGEDRWCTGVSVVDINGDGWLDIYVAASFWSWEKGRKNLLYINQGVNRDGVPLFKESAGSYGLADTGFGTQGVFFDYDKDGDLDMYLVINELNDPKTPIQYRRKVVDGSARNTDKLFRNNSNGTFTNVSREAGILIEGWGHAVSVTDFNLDGWPDLYVSNDFISNDLLYINNRNGTFTNQLSAYMKHSAWNAMGADAVDINNDGLVDLVSLEMLPEDNMRKKTMLSGNEYFNYFNSKRFGYEHQYVRNVFQLNAGMTPKGHPVFSEIGQMAGIFETDWSWAPLVADFDNDGLRDIIITNGLPRDVTDLDYIVYNNGQVEGGNGMKATLAMADSLPVVKISNYAFKNIGEAMFTNTTKTWGLARQCFSNGAAYADLDNDGDLDFVINNINDHAFVYKNTLNDSGRPGDSNTLSLILKGNAPNIQGIGATVRIYYDGNKLQFYEHQPCRGYLATVDSKAHFGLGKVKVVDSLLVQWPDGKIQRLTNIKSNRVITLSYEEATGSARKATRERPMLVFAPERSGIKHLHQERDAIDYNIQATLPHKLSQYGPGIATGDIDNNGYDDFYVSGSATYAGAFFMQDKNGRFTKESGRILSKSEFPEEEAGVIFFDADNDSDLDLYAVSGSYEFKPNHPASQDRLYLNNGKGFFELDESALPVMLTNGSCVRAADFDADGDLDLFVGGRVLSGAYPLPPRSYLLRNEGGKFVDVTAGYCMELSYMGMITDGLWTDFDEDGKVDLVVVGEWMPVTFLKNTGNKFVSVNAGTGIAQHSGWWNSLAAGDFDNDGDTDYVAGNLGLNSNYKASMTEPMTICAKDLNNDRKLDAMIFCYLKDEKGARKPFPMHTRDDMITQLVSIRRQYPTYRSFGRASIDDLWKEHERQNAVMMYANTLTTSFIENKGNGNFAVRPMPVEAQIAPVYGMLSEDVDRDGNLDLLVVGNDYGMQPFSGRHDAMNGLFLKGDGKGYFSAVTVAQSGFFVDGDGKGLALVHSVNEKAFFVATQNQDSVKVFQHLSVNDAKDRRSIKIDPDDLCAEITYEGDKKRRVEFYYGSTYLSQSSRRLVLDKDVREVVITDFRGNKREVDR